MQSSKKCYRRMRRKNSMLKIAQIGVGYWGPNILRNLVENKRCHVTAAVDLAPERRDYVHRLYPAIKGH